MPIDMTNMTEAQKLVARGMIESEKMLKESFAKNIPASQRTISEAAFIFYFLPWLSGESQDTTGELYSAWINIAGDSFSTVGLTDSSGAVVATVPGITDRNILQIRENRRENMNAIVSSAEKLSELSTISASEQTFSQLTKAVNLDSTKIEPTRAWIDEWGVLLTRYGKHPAQKAAQQKATQEKDSGQGDDIVFE